MERVNSQQSLELLRRANACCADFLSRSSSAGPHPEAEHELRALLVLNQNLEAVGTLLEQSLAETGDQEVRGELDRYRSYLLQLRAELARSQDQTLHSRSALEQRRRHLHNVRTWFNSACALG